MITHNDILTNELIDEIGEYIGFNMWRKRDLTKSYSFPGERDGEDDYADNYIDGNILEYKGIFLLVYNVVGYYGMKALYTLNLKTLKPTTNSDIKTLLSNELKNKINEKLHS